MVYPAPAAVVGLKAPRRKCEQHGAAGELAEVVGEPLLVVSVMAVVKWGATAACVRRVVDEFKLVNTLWNERKRGACIGCRKGLIGR